MFEILAHAEELHEGPLESFLHYIEPWYIALPAFVFFVWALAMLVWLITKNKGYVMIFTAVLLLISGFTLYRVSAIISVVSITGGLILSGFMAFSGLISDSRETNKPNK